MRQIRIFVAILAYALVAVGDPPNDGRWIQVVDTGEPFEAHPLAKDALKARGITVQPNSTEFGKLLAERAKKKGPLVIIDGAQMLLNPTEAYQHAQLLVRQHGPNATYIFLAEPTNQPLADLLALRDFPARTASPMNAAGLVEMALEREFGGKSEKPERVLVVSQKRAEAVLKNPAMTGSATPGEYIGWSKGSNVVILKNPPFDRVESRPTSLSATLMKAMSERTGTDGDIKAEVKEVVYEVLGGEGAPVAKRVFAFATECRAGVTREIPFKVNLYSVGDAKQSAVSKLAETRTDWVASLNSIEHLPDGQQRSLVTFSATQHHLYAAPELKISDTRRDVSVAVGPSERAEFSLRYVGGKILIDSAHSYRNVTISGDKLGEAAQSPEKDKTMEVSTNGGPIVEVVISVNGRSSTVVLVDPRHREAIAESLYPPAPLRLVETVTTYAQKVAEGGTFAPATGPGSRDGGTAPSPGTLPRTPGSPGTSTTPLILRPLPKQQPDPSIFDGLKGNFEDLSEQVRGLKLPPFEIMDSEAIDAMASALLKNEVGSIAILGEPGTGKTSMVRAFIWHVVKGNVPSIPRHTKFFELDTSTLLANTKYRGQLEEKMKAVFAAADKVPVVLFADEVHALMGAGTTTDDKNDIFQGKLKAYMADGRIRLIGVSTDAEFAVYLKDPALYQRFSQYHMKPWTKDKVVEAMAQWTKRYQYVEMPKELFEYLYELSNRYSPVGGQPRKATMLLDEYFAKAQVWGFQEHSRKNLERVAMAFYGLEAEDFDAALRARKVEEVIKQMDENVKGMKPAKAAMTKLLRFSVAGLATDNNAILITGGPGLAKTMLARYYGKGLVGEKRFHEITMADYGPRGFSSDTLKREIAKLIQKNGNAVLLLDELEKASGEVQNALYKAIGDKFIDYSPGEGAGVIRLSLENVKIIATSNAGADIIMQHQGPIVDAELAYCESVGKGEQYKAAHQGTLTLEQLKEAAKIPTRDGVISGPLVDRFKNNVVAATPPSVEEFKAIVRYHVDRKVRENSGKDVIGPVQVANIDEFVDAMVAKHWSPTMSVRGPVGDIEDTINEAIIAAKIARGDVLGAPMARDCETLFIQLSLAP